LKNDIGGAENIGARWENLRAFGRVIRVQVAGFSAGACFDDNF
jgi:hypothetical protein